MRTPAPRILQVCAVDFTAFHLLGPLLRACREAGFSTEFACADGPGAAALRSEGFIHRAIPITRSASPIHQLRAIGTLAWSLWRDRPDVVHTHTPVGGLVGRAAAALAGVPAVHTFHGLPLRDAIVPTFVERVFLIAERIVARRTRCFMSQARGDVSRAVSLRIARAGAVTVVGNGVDIQRFQPDAAVRERVRSDLGLANDDVVVITVARLVREKGLLDLADAALLLADDPRIHVLVVGSALPSDRSDVSEALREHRVAARLGGRWRLLGARADINDLLKAADVFVLPSYREGLPRSIIEAMATGLPIVATDIPACRELVQPGANGLIVPVDDARAISSALATLASDRVLRERYGARSRALAVQHHDERSVLERQLAVLREAMRR